MLTPGRISISKTWRFEIKKPPYNSIRGANSSTRCSNIGIGTSGNNKRAHFEAARRGGKVKGKGGKSRARLHRGRAQKRAGRGSSAMIAYLTVPAGTCLPGCPGAGYYTRVCMTSRFFARREAPLLYYTYCSRSTLLPLRAVLSAASLFSFFSARGAGGSERRLNPCFSLFLYLPIQRSALLRYCLCPG